ncbi:MAG: hypothetical protein IJT50_09380, partial [Lentisphaeria bacterium]|nr:hypothetical protein [Lentisphaeria bacterium]
LGEGNVRGNGPENSKTSGRLSGADVRDAILRRAGTSGPVLLFLDNVEECGEIFEGGAARFFPAGFSERVKVHVVATARVFDADPEEGSCVELPLGDLAPEAALELLLTEHPADTEEEKKAAEEVARLLGCRALFLRRVPAIIDTKNFRKAKMVCRSYTSLVKALEKDTLTAISRTGKVDELHLPGKLWELTRESLSECLLGDAALRLIRLAAHFPAEGFPKSVLRRLWDAEAFPKFAGEEMTSDEAFGFVLEMCRVYNIFQSADPVRIHRLDREAILRELGDAEPEFVDAVGRALAGFPGASPALWLPLAIQMPDILPWIPDTVIDGQITDEENRIVGFRAALLTVNPAYAEKCAWEKLNGWDWAFLLRKKPRFADRCPWEKLNSGNWADLLGAQPQFADRCPWGSFDGLDWALLLKRQPGFAAACPWEKLEGSDWAFLLRLQPQFADRCPWEKLHGSDWALLLRLQPQFADRCPWEKLNGQDWANLLGAQPRFAAICPWDKLDGRDWVELLRELPRLIDRCPKEKLAGRDWGYLVAAQPRFADICPWEKLDGLGWVNLLAEKPQFADRCPGRS